MEPTKKERKKVQPSIKPQLSRPAASSTSVKIYNKNTRLTQTMNATQAARLIAQNPQTYSYAQ